MGISSSKTKTKNEPWKEAQPFIIQGLQNSGRVFDMQQPKMEQFSGMQMDTYGRVAPGAEAGILATQGSVNTMLAGANRGMNPGAGTYTRMQSLANPMTQGYLADVAAGKYLNGNKDFDGVVSGALDDAERRVNARFGASGATNQTAHVDLLSKNLARVGGELRSGNYEAERGRMGQAAGLLGDLYNQDAGRQLGAAGAADQAYNADMAREMDAWGTSQDLMRGSQGLLNNAAELPWMGVGALNGNVRQASAGYGTTTTKQTPSVMDSINKGVSTVGNIAGTAMMLSDARAKDVKAKVGETPDGLGVYDFTYKGDPTQTPQTGVMAQEVAEKRPDALGPTTPEGLLTVDYDALKQDVPEIARPKLGLLGELEVDPTLSHPAAARKRLGAFLAAASGNPLGEAVMAMGKDARDSEESKFNSAYKMALARKAMEPEESWEDVTDANGNVIGQRSSRSNKFDPVAQADRSSQTERDTDMYLDPATPPHIKALIGARLPGTPEYIKAQAQLFGGRAEAQFPYSATANRPASGSGGQKLRKGQVVDGYTYLGGDPNNSASWRR